MSVKGVKEACHLSVQQMGVFYTKGNLISLTNSETNLIALHVKEKGF